MNGMVPLLSLPVTKVIGPLEFPPEEPPLLLELQPATRVAALSSESAVMAIFERINVSFRQLTAKAPDSAYGIPGTMASNEHGGNTPRGRRYLTVTWSITVDHIRPVGRQRVVGRRARSCRAACSSCPIARCLLVGRVGWSNDGGTFR